MNDRSLIQGQKGIAERLDISVRTLQRWLSSDDPPPVFRLHGTWCVFHEDLEEWLQAHRPAVAR